MSLLDVVLLIVGVTWIRGGAPVSALETASIVWLLLLIPLGVYWWILQAFDGVAWGWGKAWHWFLAWRRGGEVARPAD